MKVKEIMSRNPISVLPDTKFGNIWEIIFERRISGLPVVHEDNQLIGIISEEDIIEKLYPSYEEYFFDPQISRDFERMEANISKVAKLEAKDFMNKDVYTTTEDAPIMKAASSMMIYRVSCLPVTEEARHKKILVGIVCKGDIFSQLFRVNMEGTKKGTKRSKARAKK